MEAGTKKPGLCGAGLSGKGMPSLDFELSAVDCVRAKLFLDTEELVVFGDAVGATEGAGLDLATVGCNCDISDGGVFGFTGTVGEN